MKQPNTRHLTLASLFLAIALAIQYLRLPQPLTGTAINCILLMTGFFTTPRWGFAVGLLTPFAAVMTGVVPPIMFAATPFIALGNALYVLIFHRVYGPTITRKFLALGLASSAKFLLLFGAVTLVLSLPEPAGAMLTFPQLGTAILGGALAMILIRLFNRIF